VVTNDDGRGVQGIDIFAYAARDSSVYDQLPERPVYRTQTSADGTFTFNYLALESYFVVGIKDQNNNRLPDPGELVALPIRESFFARIDSTDDGAQLVAFLSDEAPPEARRVRSVSSRRTAIRYSESVLPVADSTAWVITDSVSSGERQVAAVYTSPEDSRELIAVVAQPMSPGRKLLRTGMVADSTGNTLASQTFPFTPANTADTVQVRFLGFGRPPSQRPIELLPSGTPIVRFNQALDPNQFVQAVDDASGDTLGFSSTSGDGRSFLLAVDSGNNVFRLNVATSQDTTYRQSYRRLPPNELGDISGVAEAGPERVVVEAFARGQAIPAAVDTTEASGQFTLRGLLPGFYRLRFFADRNGNRSWDGGSISPFSPGERVSWVADTLQARARFEVVLTDTLRLPVRP
jgi:hypothetical protein